jgi:hypothetical protein
VIEKVPTTNDISKYTNSSLERWYGISKSNSNNNKQVPFRFTFTSCNTGTYIIEEDNILKTDNIIKCTS